MEVRELRIAVGARVEIGPPIGPSVVVVRGVGAADLDLRVETGSLVVTYPQFCAFYGNDPSIHVVSALPPDASVFLVGWRDVVGVFPESERSSVVYRMRRRFEDDWAPQRITFFTQDGMFVLVYEEGAARIESTGIVAWEHSLDWSDTVESMNSTQIQFVDEDHAPSVVWKTIDVKTGEMTVRRG